MSTGNGEVVIHDHHGSLEASTGYETIVAYVEEFGEAGVRLRTEGPSMIVHLPPEQGFDLDARVDRSTVGKVGVRQSFDLPVEEVGRGHRARGSVRGGGPPVRLEVGRGYLSVVDRRPNEDR